MTGSYSPAYGLTMRHRVSSGEETGTVAYAVGQRN